MSSSPEKFCILSFDYIYIILFSNDVFNISLFLLFVNILLTFFENYSKYTQNYIEKNLCKLLCLLSSLNFSWLSPRFISIGQLNILLYLHLQPIYHVVFMESYYLIGMRYLILGWASHLDAFSVYPFHTQLLSRATGATTDTPSVCPSWSSRTKDSSLQISSACDR